MSYFGSYFAGGSTVTITISETPGNPVVINTADNNRMTLVQGDDHATGEALPAWGRTDYDGPDLTSATATLRLLGTDSYFNSRASTDAELEVSATLSQTGTTLTASAALTAAQTAALTATPDGHNESYQYQFVANTGTEIITLWYGPCTVVRSVAAQAS